MRNGSRRAGARTGVGENAKVFLTGYALRIFLRVRLSVGGDGADGGAFGVADAAEDEGEVVFLEADELHAAVDFFEEADAGSLFEAGEDYLGYGEGGEGELGQGAVAVDAGAEVDLTYGGEAELLQEVDEEAGLHAVARE